MGIGFLPRGGGGARVDYELSTETIKTLDPLSNTSVAGAGADGNGSILFMRIRNPDRYDKFGNKTVLAAELTDRSSPNIEANGGGGVLALGGIKQVGVGEGSYYQAQSVVDAIGKDGIKLSLNSLSNGRVFFGTTKDGGGSTLVAGGSINYLGNLEGNSGILSSVEKITSAFNRSTLTSLSTSRSDVSTGGVDGNGASIFAGGTYISAPHTLSAIDTVDRYDTSGNRSTLTPLSRATSYLSGTKDYGGNTLFGGGRESDRGYAIKYSKEGNRIAVTSMPWLSTNTVSSAATDGDGNTLFGGDTVIHVYDKNGNWRIISEVANSGNLKTNGIGEVLCNIGIVVKSISISTIPSISLMVPPRARYKFYQHSEEQINDSDTNIFLDIVAPNSGYIKYINNTVIIR